MGDVEWGHSTFLDSLGLSLGQTPTVDWVRAAVNPLGCRTSFSYNAAGQPVAVIDANSTRATTVFDATGRAVATINALGYRVTQVFDAADRRTALVDARANRYSFVWDDASRQIRLVDPLSRAVTLAYNAASEQTVRIDARGFRTTYVHDNISRLMGRQYPDGSRVSMAYDAVSNRTLLADSTGRYTTLFDALNRARAVTNPAQLTISYGFDGAGRRSWMVEPSGGRFTYGYSPTNLNTLVVNPQGERTTWQFDMASRVTVQRLANLIRVSYAYDDADRLIRLANLTSTGTTITSYRDTWDPVNNRLARVEQDGTRVTWSYDATYQLMRERRNGANSYDTTYGYDPAGNRRLKLENLIRTTYSYDPANQLQKYVDNTGTTTFGFDASGNQRLQQTPSSGTTTNTWDYENRLTKVALASGVLNTFAFNGDGQRVQRQDSSGTSKQIWDDQKIVEETDQNNLVQAIYTQSAGSYGDIVSQRRSGLASYYLFDPLCSTSRLTNGIEAVTDSYLFKAFGEVLIAGPTINPFEFSGALGYYYDGDPQVLNVRARTYAPALGRLESRDRASVLSSYVYGRQNPATFIDPSGLLDVKIGQAAANPCGGLDVTLNFVLAPNEIGPQFAVVQRLCISCTEADCLVICPGVLCVPNTQTGSSCCYWEFFPQVQGGVYPDRHIRSTGLLNPQSCCTGTDGEHKRNSTVYLIADPTGSFARSAQKWKNRISCGACGTFFTGTAFGILDPSPVAPPPFQRQLRFPGLRGIYAVLATATWSIDMNWSCCRMSPLTSDLDVVNSHGQHFIQHSSVQCS